jgi:hypothetical protein
MEPKSDQEPSPKKLKADFHGGDAPTILPKGVSIEGGAEGASAPKHMKVLVGEPYESVALTDIQVAEKAIRLRVIRNVAYGSGLVLAALIIISALSGDSAAVEKYSYALISAFATCLAWASGRDTS